MDAFVPPLAGFRDAVDAANLGLERDFVAADLDSAIAHCVLCLLFGNISAWTHWLQRPFWHPPRVSPHPERQH
jgi:hypothetical protein